MREDAVEGRIRSDLGDVRASRDGESKKWKEKGGYQRRRASGSGEVAAESRVGGARLVGFLSVGWDARAWGKPPLSGSAGKQSAAAVDSLRWKNKAICTKQFAEADTCPLSC